MPETPQSPHRPHAPRKSGENLDPQDAADAQSPDRPDAPRAGGRDDDGAPGPAADAGEPDSGTAAGTAAGAGVGGPDDGPGSGGPAGDLGGGDVGSDDLGSGDLGTGERGSGDLGSGPLDDVDVLAVAEDGLSAGERIGAAVLAAAGRATLPFQAARADRSFATAFWYNDLVESAPGHEVIRQYLVTAEARTRYEIGQWTLRAGIAEPELPADELVMPSFAKKWTRLGALGVAVMPTVDLHIHAEKKGWRWRTDEVTAGLAAQPADIALIGAEPLPAYVLGHEVEQDAAGRHTGRPQRLLPGAVARTSDDPAAPVRFTAPLPDGFAGAPVFAALPMDDDRLKLVCLGIALPEGGGRTDGGDGTAGGAAAGTTVVTFDVLRPAIHAVTPPRRRHWWQRG